jgi:putative flippase GtrA
MRSMRSIADSAELSARTRVGPAPLRPSRSKVEQRPDRRIIRFITIGVATYLVATSTLFFTHGLLHVNIFTATTIAHIIALIVNFSGSRSWTFSAHCRIIPQLIRYFSLCGLNYVILMIMMAGLLALDMHYIVAKTGADAALAGLDYLAYRWWVFRPQATSGSGPTTRPTDR